MLHKMNNHIQIYEMHVIVANSHMQFIYLYMIVLPPCHIIGFSDIFLSETIRIYIALLISKICRSEIASCAHKIRLVQHCYGCHNQPASTRLARTECDVLPGHYGCPIGENFRKLFQLPRKTVGT